MRARLISVISICCLLLLGITIVSAAPMGEDVDTGFRPSKDGFGFENYGGQVCSWLDCYSIVNLTSAEVQRMFGNQVCKSVKSDGTCVLSQVAKSWMSEINSYASQGHCEGMAVLSALFYAGYKKQPKDFGGRTTNSLQLKGNESLQRELAYWFATQWFMDDYLIQQEPNKQLATLMKAYSEKPNVLYPIGIFKSDKSGGHAITAYGVRDKGNGIYWIMVYDNNYPDEERYITVDTNKNSWYYSGSSLPSIASADYEGKGSRNEFQLAPIGPRVQNEGKFACDFCPQSSSWQQPSSPSVEPTEEPSDDSGIPDWLKPWIEIPTEEPSSPSSQPTESPSDDSGIPDWLKPWITVPTEEPSNPSSEPTEEPSDDSNIPDWLKPWITVPTEEPAEPTNTPSSRRPTAAPTEESNDNMVVPDWLMPFLSPTALPSLTSSPAPTDQDKNPEKYNKISANSAINIFIQDLKGNRSGYDWETEKTYDEISGINVKTSIRRTSATLPKNMTYYLWMNQPEKDKLSAFDVSITAPGTVLSLTNLYMSDEYPNFVYDPPEKESNSGFEIERFNIVSKPGQLPGVEYAITDDNAEYHFKLTSAFSGNQDSETPVIFKVFRNYNSGIFGLWIQPVEGESTTDFKNQKFSMQGEFSMWDKNGKETVVKIGEDDQIDMQMNGMFMINYSDWAKGKGFSVSGDLNGDTKFETKKAYEAEK